jgi:HD-GYP domain-containing protein (c-di-GMP phosphodiesterase class II)
MSGISLEDKLQRLELLHRVGMSLSTEKNRDRLLETILVEAKTICRADGGTLYLRTNDDQLRFAIMRSDSLGIRLGGTTGKPIELPTLPMFDPETGEPNHANVATYAASLKRSVNVGDAYDTLSFDFTGTKRFDNHHQYRSQSFLTIPMLNHEDRVIGVLQLINARDPSTGEVVPFAPEDQQLAEALASQAGIALHNQMLLEEQRILLESFIKVLAAAIDAKSPHTGGHCERVPVLAEMLVHAACSECASPFAAFDMTEEERYEFRIAAWLHDCGKVVTPPHVMDKATKLETIFDRMDMVRDRFEILRRDAELEAWEKIRNGATHADEAWAEHTSDLAELDAELAFLERVNIGGEFLAEADIDRIHKIAERCYRKGGELVPLLTPDEVANLSVRRGTLTENERLIINGHMVQTIRMLESLPFPSYLERVPEYAGGHHERMDGKGYPRGLFASDMSIPARAMAIADVFEALTAKDRPYKPGKPLSEAMKIMGQMKRFNHLDPSLFDLFVRSGVYRAYAERFVSPEQIDVVDEEALLAIVPEPYELPAPEEREMRGQGFLSEYEEQVHRSVHPPPVSMAPNWLPRSHH